MNFRPCPESAAWVQTVTRTLIFKQSPEIILGAPEAYSEGLTVSNTSIADQIGEVRPEIDFAEKSTF